MSSAALRQAWAQWSAFVEELDLGDGSPDCPVLHGRLFRLSGSYSLRARELRAARDGVRNAFEPWLGAGTTAPEGELERLRLALSICEPGWRALLRLEGRLPIWNEVERVALTAGLAWPEGVFWASPLHVQGERNDLLTALRGRDYGESLALLGALLHLLNHPRGAPLFEWARLIPVLRRPSEVLHVANLFSTAFVEGALREEWLAPLGWAPLPARFRQLCEDICLCLLHRLNEPMPELPLAGRGATQQKGARQSISRRAVPEPLPVEPYFQKIAGSEAFLRAIAEEPLEGVHRLAFADWLDEQGHTERGQFIRLQCQAERLPDHPLARRQFTEPAEALFKKHGAAWTANLSERIRSEWNKLEYFTGGLLQRAEFTDAPGRKIYEQLFQAIDLRHLATGLSGSFCPAGEGGVRGLLELPWLSRLVSLELNQCDSVEQMRALVSAAALVGLVHLGLDVWNSSPGLIRDMVGSIQLPALASLTLGSTLLCDENIRALAAADLPGSLRKLVLRGSGQTRRSWYNLGLPGMRALASSPSLAGLEHLDVAWNISPAAGVEALAASPFLTNLTTLVLRHTSVGNKGAKALATSPVLTRLVCLDLSATGLHDEGVRVLARSANLVHLSVLDLGGNHQVGEPGLRALLNSPHLSGLRALSLRGVPLSLEAVRALATGEYAAKLDTLDLSETRLGSPAVRELVQSPHLNNLAVLDLRQEDNGLSVAMKSAVRKRWPFARL